MSSTPVFAIFRRSCSGGWVVLGSGLRRLAHNSRPSKKRWSFGDIVDEKALRQFGERLTKAGFGLDGLADEAQRTAGALRNVPTGFKFALASFDATAPTMLDAESFTSTTVSGGAGDPPASEPGTVVNYLAGAITNNIDARSMTPEEIFEAAERGAQRAAARGIATTLPTGMARR